MGRLFSAFADLEDELRHGDLAIAHGETALRHRYHVGGPEDCGISHFNLANYLMRGGGVPAAALGHRVACAVIHLQTADGRLHQTLGALARYLASFAPAAPPVPRSFDELCALVEQVEGVRFRELFARLPTEHAATGDEALQQVLELAHEEGQRQAEGRRQADEETDGPSPEFIRFLEPWLEKLAQAASEGPAAVEGVLQGLRKELLRLAPPEAKEQVEGLIAQLRAGANAAETEP